MYSLMSPGSVSFVICRKAACRPLFFIRSLGSTSSNSDKNSARDIRLTHYQILGIEKDASSEDVRSAFIRLSKDYHPDINSSDPQNHDKFVDINEAYSVLSKPLLRREYDNELVYRLKGHGRNTSRPYSSTADFYAESPYYDPQFYANRDKSQDAFYANKPFYGVKGISKISNQSVVSICMAVIVIGAAFHFFVVKKLSDIHIENLNARDRKNHQIWVKANDPENNSELMRVMRIKAEENEQRIRNKAKEGS